MEVAESKNKVTYSRSPRNDEWEHTQKHIQGVLPHPNGDLEQGRPLEGC